MHFRTVPRSSFERKSGRQRLQTQDFITRALGYRFTSGCWVVAWMQQKSNGDDVVITSCTSCTVVVSEKQRDHPWITSKGVNATRCSQVRCVALDCACQLSNSFEIPSTPYLLLIFCRWCTYVCKNPSSAISRAKFCASIFLILINFDNYLGHINGNYL